MTTYRYENNKWTSYIDGSRSNHYFIDGKNMTSSYIAASWAAIGVVTIEILIFIFLV